MTSQSWAGNATNANMSILVARAYANYAILKVTDVSTKVAMDSWGNRSSKELVSSFCLAVCRGMTVAASINALASHTAGGL
jgi:hypothetical protein